MKGFTDTERPLEEEEEEELWVQRGPGVNEVSFRTRPHHNAHSTLGVDTGATDPRWRVEVHSNNQNRYITENGTFCKYHCHNMQVCRP
jgi:hypothetical protein